MKVLSSKSLVALLVVLSLLWSFVGCDINFSGGKTTASTSSGTSSGTSLGTSSTTDSTNSKYIPLNFYSINDLHGSVKDEDGVTGIGRLTTYFNSLDESKNNILLSAGDMWQGGAESNNTKGKLVTDWMNQMNFVAMTVGNHEFDWGTSYVKANAEMAEFPFLGINVYDRATNQRVEYCEPSVMIEKAGLKIGIIGAIGDHYSSISASRVTDIYFKTGNDLTNLVKNEADSLRQQGADIVIYVIHSGYATKTTNTTVSDSKLEHYDTSLSNGYIDLVFEAHTHTQNIYTDKYGVYHLQGGGYNEAFSHVELAYNTEDKSFFVSTTELIKTSYLTSYEIDASVPMLYEKYSEEIGDPYAVLGYNAAYRNSSYLSQLVAELYLKAGLEKWGEEYNIVLGGGKINCRSPYKLYQGDVCYADLLELFPFDNDIVLCSIKGSYLKSRYLENDGYNIDLSDFGIANQNQIDSNATYYIITDSYGADYTWNNVTVIDIYDISGVFARDLLAEYVKSGGLDR